MDQLAAAQKAIETGKKMTAEGKNVRYIRSTFVPGEGKCMCLFEAPSQQSVKELNDTAKTAVQPASSEALDLTYGSGSKSTAARGGPPDTTRSPRAA